MTRLDGLVITSGLVLLSGCADWEGFNRSGYRALRDRDCVISQGYPCLPDAHPSYEEYQRERAKVLEKPPAQP